MPGDGKGAELATTLVGDRRLEDAKVPVAVLACDLRSGEPDVLRSGPAALALEASAALPGFFRPVESEDRLLADGGDVGVVPTWVAREMGADVVIRPDFGGPVETLDLSRIAESVEAGERAARDARPAIRKCEGPPRRAWWRWRPW